METYISILRGINVSGQKKVPMVTLKSLYEQLGFVKVITYIQSGNVIFQTKNKSAETVGKLIEKVITKGFGFHVPVIIRTATEMEDIIKNNPFVNETDVDVEKLHVTFLADVPSSERTGVITQLSFDPDRFFILHKEVYLYCPVNYGNTKLNNIFFENKLKVNATTRNWKTINKLVEMAAELN